MGSPIVDIEQLRALRATGQDLRGAVLVGLDLARDTPGYRAAVGLGRALGRGLPDRTVLTGGGPGAMEAVPLGVRLSTADNHYGSLGPPAPMVFLGKDFWLNEVPAAPLVQQLAKGRASERWILVTDDLDEAVALLADYADEAS